MKEFECKRCGGRIYLAQELERDPLCPSCRGGMVQTGDSKKAKELQKYECFECKMSFYMKEKEKPYKCPFCNYSFPVTPRIKQEERL
ncbi:hypothetical protein KAW18_00175 [candidate division WOR-3 bacterium]|nr:hypothetical protein [candidate division WOR-3 bacterium]MCK4525755.1 hypothetical protein [candidate division WOR-3 bacterium]